MNHDAIDRLLSSSVFWRLRNHPRDTKVLIGVNCVGVIGLQGQQSNNMLQRMGHSLLRSIIRLF